MKILLTIIGITLSSCLFAQPSFEWANQIGGAGTVASNGVEIDDDGNSFSFGFFNGTSDFDPGVGVFSVTSNGSSDGFVLKLDSNGNLVWVFNFGGTGIDNIMDIVLNQNNEVIITARYQNSVTFNIGGTPTTFNSNGSTDFLVLKLNSSGVLQWAKSFGGANSDNSNNIHINSTNEIYVTGYFNGTCDFDPSGNVNSQTSNGGTDWFGLKLDSSGNLLWVKTFGSSASNEDYISSRVDNNGSLILTGTFKQIVDFDPGAAVNNVTPAGLGDTYLLKLDQNGAFVWIKTIGASGYESNGRAVCIDFQDNIILAGNFEGVMDLDPGSGFSTHTSNGIFDVYILKLTQNGIFVWSKTFGGAASESPMAIEIDNLNNIYTTGGYESLTDFDPGPGVANFPGGTYPDQFLQSLDSNGDYLWAQTLRNGNFGIYSKGVAINNYGSIYWGGHFLNGPIDLDPTAGEQIVSSTGFDLFLIKQCINVLPLPDITSLPDLIDECSVSSPASPTASNCSGSYTGVPNITFPITNQGTTTVTWTYDNGNGNTSTQTQNVIITDVTAPVADLASLSNVTAQCEVTSLTAPTATDNCAGLITGTHNASLPITAQGTTTVTWTYDDGNGNTSTQTQDVVITDGTAPAADVANLSDINSECEVTPTAPTATDNCEGAVTGTPDVSFPITATGTTTVTWTYDDGNGNTSTQTQDVIITPIDNSVSVVDDLTLSADASGYTYQWVDCNDNNAPIAGETNQTFEATANGSYAVVIDNGDCSVTSTCFDITTVGLNNNELQTINVFPNPTSGTVTINSSAQINMVEVVNVMGQVVFKTTLNEVSTHQVELPEAKGVYLVKVSGNTTNDTFRIIKK